MNVTRMVRAAGVLAVLAGAAIVGSCSSDKVTATKEVAVARVALASPVDSLLIGDSVSLNVTVEDGNGVPIGRPVTWTSSDPALATVSATGWVKAYDSGIATITASVDGFVAAVQLHLLERVTAAAIQRDQTRDTLHIRDTLWLHVQLHDPHGAALQRRVTWQSSNDSIVTVGVVDSSAPALARGPSASGGSALPNMVVGGGQAFALAVGAGAAVITASSEGVTDTVTLNVGEPVASVELSISSATVGMGSQLQLQARLRDRNQQELQREIRWTTSNPAVATVDSTGKVTGVGLGVCTITAESESKTAAATFTVVTAAGVFTVTPGAVSLPIGGTFKPTIVLTDAAGAPLGRQAIWVSADTTVATVDAAGLITAVAPGATKVVGTIDALSATIDVAVVAPTPSLSITPAAPSVAAGTEFDLVATILDVKGKRITNETVVWSSSDAAVVSVNASGHAVAHAEGSATITAVSPSARNSVLVTVTPSPVSTVSLNPPRANVRVGDHFSINAALADAGGQPTHGNVTWTSSNETILTVSATGVVTAVGEGEATITASSGGKSSSASVTVTGPRPTTDEGLGNNLSVPVVFSEGIGITGLSVTAGGAPNYGNTGLRPVQSENLVVDGLPYFYIANVSDCTWPDGTKAYCQKGLNAWQAQWLDGSTALQHASATWGDNIINQSLKTSSPIRVEVSLNDLTSGTLRGFNMQVVSGSGSTEVQGTNGVTAAMTPTIYSVVPHLIVSKLDASGGNTVGDPLVDKRVIDALGAEESSGNFAAEVNVGGRIVFGYNLRVSEAGWYRVAFVLDGSVSNGLVSANRNVVMDAVTNTVTEEESGGSGGSGTGTKPVPQLAPDGSRTWVDIYVAAGSGSGTGGGGGEDTGAGNNLSVPLTFAEGLGLTGLPVTVGGMPNYANTGLRPTGATEPVVEALPYFPMSYNLSNCSLGGTPYFCQGGGPVWQAQWFDASGQSMRDAQVAWGDNLLTNHFNTHANVHVEVSLTDLTTPPMQGYNMAVVSGSGSTELDGTNGTTGTFSPVVYTRGARLKVELLDSATHEPRYTVFEQGLWEAGDGPGQLVTEVSMGGTLVYSYNLLVQQITIPESVGHKYGWYRFTFSIDGSAPVRPNVRMTQIAAGGEEGTTDEGGGSGGNGSGGSGSGGIPSKNVPTLNVGAQTTSIDIWIAKGGGGSGGGEQ